jgi:anti-sigma regulatory factor (Ser/Thr protein kinase)
MVALLWDAGRVAEAIELESLWNELGLQVPFSLFCAYPSRSVVGDDQAHALHEVCHLHSAIVGQTAPPSAREFDRETHAPRAARRFVAEQLEQWGRDELVDDAAVVVTELATNAVVHATSEFTVSMSLSEGCVRIAVRDASAVLPTLRELGSTNATSGRGIALVAAIASQWGAEQMADGKIVWAKLGA